MMHRKQRRAIVLSVYFLIFFGLLWWIVGMIRPEPSCFDGKQNQNEQGVDCGGVCTLECTKKIPTLPTAINASYVIDGADGRVDAVAQITNPNNLFGAAKVPYRFELKDAAGAVIAERVGETFVLPSETKYILEPGIDITGGARVVSAHFEIIGTELWQQFDGYQEPRIIVLNKTYTVTELEAAYSRVEGLVRNESEFDFASISVNVVLKDGDGTPIAIHRTRMDTFDSGMERGFSLPWPHKFPGEVATFDVEVEANIFDVANFRKQYMTGTRTGGR